MVGENSHFKAPGTPGMRHICAYEASTGHRYGMLLSRHQRLSGHQFSGGGSKFQLGYDSLRSSRESAISLARRESIVEGQFLGRFRHFAHISTKATLERNGEWTIP